MRTEQIALSPLAPGASLSLTVQRFGAEGARPQVYIQASLHADEIPGMIVALTDLLDRSPAASELQMREAISGNLCRCTGYGRIFAAFRQAQTERAHARA